MDKKITFYDISVYLFPGGLLLGASILIFSDLAVWNKTAIIEQFSFFFQCMLLLMAYVAGFVIHSMAEIFEKEKDNNRMLWRTRWVTTELNKLKDEKSDIIQQQLTSLGIDKDTPRFQTEFFEQMRAETVKDSRTAENLSVMHAQSMMFRNACMSFLLLIGVIVIHFIVKGFDCQLLIWGAIPSLLLSCICFRMAVLRKKAIIRTILWKYSSALYGKQSEKKQ